MRQPDPAAAILARVAAGSEAALSEFYRQNGRSAKKLLEVCGDLEKAKVAVDRSAAHWKAQGLDWSLNAVVRDVSDPSRLQGGRNGTPRKIVGEAAPKPGKYGEGETIET